MVNLPPEEAREIREFLAVQSIDLIFLVAPTTPDDRVGVIAGQASGFIYYVSLKGVTGAANIDAGYVEQNVARIRAHTSLPVAVGFGIKDAESAAAIAAFCDGVVVGSALVNLVAGQIESGASNQRAMDAAAALLGEIRQGIDAVTS